MGLRDCGSQRWAEREMGNTTKNTATLTEAHHKEPLKNKAEPSQPGALLFNNAPICSI